MRVQPRLLAVVPLLAAMVGCGLATLGRSVPLRHPMGSRLRARQFARSAMSTTAA